MGDLKTCLVPVFLALPVEAGTTSLAPNTFSNPLDQFATCAGRFSALMEHQWLMDGPESEKTALEVAAMVGLVQAALPTGTHREVLARQIEAKAAQRSLLMQADFGRTEAERKRARARSDDLIGTCRALLLG